MKYVLSISLLLLIGFSCNQHTARMDHYQVHGIDVSHYQSSINWDTVASQNIYFAFIKATEGISYNDSLYCHNWEEVKRVGIKRGAYHFFRPRVSGELQARNFANWVEIKPGDLPPVLDVEVLDDVSKSVLIRGIRDWLYLTEIHFNIKPIIYTNLKFYNKYLAGQFADYPIWIARYNTTEPRLACGRDWQFWQYGNQGRVKGIYGDVDFNVFYGDSSELNNLCFAPSVPLSLK